MMWIPARSLDEAVRVARAIDQHAQAMEVNRFLRRGRYSVIDLARAPWSARRLCWRSRDAA